MPTHSELSIGSVFTVVFSSTLINGLGKKKDKSIDEICDSMISGVRAKHHIAEAETWKPAVCVSVASVVSGGVCPDKGQRCACCDSVVLTTSVGAHGGPHLKGNFEIELCWEQ